MISVEKALQHIKSNIKKTTVVINKPITHAVDYALAEDIISPIHMPPFYQSAMDGYALGSTNQTIYQLIGEVKAGDQTNYSLNPKEAVRIFTGAPVPTSAKAVIMQEKVSKKDHQIILNDTVLPNANIRPIGEQIKKGDVALSKETILNPASIGYIAALGITHVPVYKKPSIAIIATGNELIPPGQPLQHGQVYESNATMLSTALIKSGFDDISSFKIEDEYDITHAVIQSTIDQYDVVLISGGISVGDYDFVEKALNQIDVESIFYKVKQKPGKPLYFGKKNNKFVFALPGNPGSSLNCFYVYVLPALYTIAGCTTHPITRTTAIAMSNYSKKGARAEFLKAIVKNGKATILDRQASSMLRSFALCNALIYLPEESQKISTGDTVEIFNLP